MSAVKSWSVTVCLVSVICTIIEILFPKGKMEKIFQENGVEVETVVVAAVFVADST